MADVIILVEVHYSAHHLDYLGHPAAGVEALACEVAGSHGGIAWDVGDVEISNSHNITLLYSLFIRPSRGSLGSKNYMI